MNGRVYDYNLGRFMSVDPVIQSPGNSQSINPYSYIMNNPLAGTDPTGYSAECDDSGSCDIGNIAMDDVENIQVTKDGNMVVNTKDGSSYQVESINGADAGGKFAVGNNSPVDIGGQQEVASRGTSGSGNAERTWGSYLPFVEVGDSSAQTWANWAVEADKNGDMSWHLHFAGGVASLWTPNTAAETSFTLFGGELFALGGKAYSYASSKIIGNAQSTGTLGHATISKIYAYAYAMNPNVTKVTMDLGYKRLMDGVKSMRLKYGPRPDVAARYKDGSVRVKEIASKTDKPAQLIRRNQERLDAEGIPNSISVSNMAVKINKLFGK